MPTRIQLSSCVEELKEIKRNARLWAHYPVLREIAEQNFLNNNRCTALEYLDGKMQWLPEFDALGHTFLGIHEIMTEPDLQDRIRTVPTMLAHFRKHLRKILNLPSECC